MQLLIISFAALILFGVDLQFVNSLLLNLNENFSCPRDLQQIADCTLNGMAHHRLEAMNLDGSIYWIGTRKYLIAKSEHDINLKVSRGKCSKTIDLPNRDGVYNVNIPAFSDNCRLEYVVVTAGGRERSYCAISYLTSKPKLSGKLFLVQFGKAVLVNVGTVVTFDCGQNIQQTSTCKGYPATMMPDIPNGCPPPPKETTSTTTISTSTSTTSSTTTTSPKPSTTDKPSTAPTETPSTTAPKSSSSTTKSEKAADKVSTAAKNGMFSDSDLDSDDSDVTPYAPLRQPRLFRTRRDPFIYYTDVEFKTRFRFTKPNAAQIIELVRHQVEPATNRSSSISADLRVLIALHYLGGNTRGIDDGDWAGVSQGSACRLMHKAIRAIAELAPKFVEFPKSRHNVLQAQRGFQQLCTGGNPQLPPMRGIVGAIDGCHVKIECPNKTNSGFYMNRKQFHSINCMFVCNASQELTWIVAHWYGSAHDNRIFRESPLKQKFENGEFGDVLIADSGYALEEYVLTPVLNPRTAAEARYNRSHIKTRNVIERTNGLLKSRFRCLIGSLRLHIENIEPAIVACGVLHNLALKFKDPQFDPLDPQYAQPVIPQPLWQNGGVNAAVSRAAYVHNHFG